MKTLTYLPLFAILFFGLTFQSCVDDNCKEVVSYVRATPQYLSLDELRVTLEAEEPRDLVKPGKFFFINNIMFINEKHQGVHIIDNTNPSSPNSIGFINIPGNIDIAANGQYLYADNAMDLVTFDISDPRNPVFIDRKFDVFPDQTSNDPDRVLVGYQYENIVEERECGNAVPWGRGFSDDNAFILESGQSINNSGNIQTDQGVAGSQSRFGIAHNTLYVVREHSMELFSLSNPASPQPGESIDFNFWGGVVETIFPHGEHLFLGTTNGMLIYNNSDPANPVYVSNLAHARACDPVYVKDNYAYVTLRDGSACEGFNNQLDLIDISNLSNPFLKETFKMDNPHGLSIFDETLFVCEGTHGMKIFDIAKPEELDKNRLAKLSSFDAYDVITLQINDQKVMMVIGADGYYQYDFENLNNPELLSVIEVAKQ